MKHYRRFGDWFFQFASSQENIDCLATCMTRIVAVLGTITIALFLVVLRTGT
ncbi:hypothetical protein [Paraburkholderia bannensis]|uniref:hypothetical protein n=1 Tax=Paraburkholderia bannensis TaxID=765414 RepID=UPI002ABDCC05|nr:hypothetical protein [Paraburkholderia bannensis]